MSVNSYLNDLAQRAIVRNNEKESIQISIDTILQRLKSYDENKYQIGNTLIFGSYKRNTMLSRKFDEDSDVDIMVIFGKKAMGFYSFEPRNNQPKSPQTYLNYLKDFAESKYPTSLRRQDFPTIVLELNHIKFELVPAIIDDWGQYKIPNKPKDWYSTQEWISTNPNDLDGELCNNQTLRRLVRIAKIWNAKQGYIYESYELEKWIIYNSFYGNPNENLAQHFYRFCELLPINLNLSQENQRKIQKLKDSAKNAKYSDDKSTIQDLFE
ncbi:nucleotidyltransferase [Helicobacter pullorum]|uniref:SMODS domain-containing nucleotidyltransferase n=1 Tax=Helicobacter pullorum TaxID=35818 RepID=UPI0008168393|nr:nucleotidyltransferase [Helicobacter pullorum]OCR13808.1 nucleotidyltransferase [Helicobacter pullorum]